MQNSGSMEMMGLNSHTLLVIKLPDSRALRIMSRSLFVALVFMAMPSLLSMVRAISGGATLCAPDTADSNTFKFLPLLLHDLVDEGLINKGNNGFVVADQINRDQFKFLRDAGINMVTGAELQQRNTVENEAASFDFVFASSFQGLPVADGMLKHHGLVISPLGRDPSDGLRSLSRYKIVYLRRFESTVVAMRKAGATPEEKRAALEGLEDVYLEPPRPRRAMLSPISMKMRFLPDVLEDVLDEYPRRVFVSDDSAAVEWFYGNYPRRGREFEVYELEVGDGAVSEWMREKVKREEYVVMKAEAQVVEEMLSDKSMYLVDELFLECKNEWQDDGTKRAYWQCLELYGKLRDQGIAVHQYW